MLGTKFSRLLKASPFSWHKKKNDNRKCPCQYIENACASTPSFQYFISFHVLDETLSTYNFSWPQRRIIFITNMGILYLVDSVKWCDTLVCFIATLLCCYHAFVVLWKFCDEYHRQKQLSNLSKGSCSRLTVAVSFYHFWDSTELSQHFQKHWYCMQSLAWSLHNTWWHFTHMCQQHRQRVT